MHLRNLNKERAEIIADRWLETQQLPTFGEVRQPAGPRVILNGTGEHNGASFGGVGPFTPPQASLAHSTWAHTQSHGGLTRFLASRKHIIMLPLQVFTSLLPLPPACTPHR